MAFADSEESIQEGRPAYFLTFSRSTKVWRYTDIDQNLTLDSNIFTAVPFRIPDISQSGDAKADEVSITMPADAPLCQYLDSMPISSVIDVQLRKAHLIEDTLTGLFSAPAIADAPVVWVGEVIEVKRMALNQREVVCNTLSLTMSRQGLRLTWGRSCPHALFGRGCFVDKALYAVAAPAITVVDGITISAAVADGYADEHFSGGFLTFESEPGVVESRGIETHVGSTLVVFGSTLGMAGGSNFTLYPGCSRTADVCHNKFSNILNFGGIYHLSGKSPFDGTPIY